MSNKKFTDEEIKSSLEVIATTRNCNECKIRNCKWGTCNCSQITANAALDLINRQKTEIEKLKGSTIVSNIMESQKIKREAKAEAYKEFADRIRQVIVLNNTHDGYLVHDIDYNCLMEDIDDVLKELVGDNK